MGYSSTVGKSGRIYKVMVRTYLVLYLFYKSINPRLNELYRRAASMKYENMPEVKAEGLLLLLRSVARNRSRAGRTRENEEEEEDQSAQRDDAIFFFRTVHCKRTVKKFHSQYDRPNRGRWPPQAGPGNATKGNGTFHD